MWKWSAEDKANPIPSQTMSDQLFEEAISDILGCRPVAPIKAEVKEEKPKCKSCGKGCEECECADGCQCDQKKMSESSNPTGVKVLGVYKPTGKVILSEGVTSDMEDEGPQEGDWVTEQNRPRNSKDDMAWIWREVGSNKEFVGTVAQLKKKMREDGFWGTMWNLSDHGNLSIIKESRYLHTESKTLKTVKIEVA